MFAVIYKGHVHQGVEAEYKRLWRQIAQYFIEHRGALGSCLHKTAEGEWVAYSRWPDKAMRDASWPQEGESVDESLSTEIKQAIESLKKCIDKDQPYQEICMEVVDDFLFSKEQSHA